MKDETTNYEIYREYFSSDEMDFGDWVKSYLVTNATFPFVLGGLLDTDLNDLLRELLAAVRGDDHEKIENGIREGLLGAAQSLNLEGVGLLAHAVAYSGMNSLARTVAIAIDTVAYKLASSGWDHTTREDAFLAFDQMFASLATLAMSGDSTSLRVAEKYFRDPIYSPFSSILFTPVSIQDIEKWLFCG